MQNIKPKSGKNPIEMETDDLAQGIYLVQIVVGNSIVFGKLVKE